jgi:hypothetical protein
MKKTCSKKMYILALIFILMLGITQTQARVVNTGTVDMLLIGTFISPNAKGNSRTFDLWTKEDNWRFTVTKARAMSGAGVTGWRLLSDIFPRKIMLIGNEKVLAPLRKSEIVGKDFKLRGTLYIVSKRYHLSRVEEVGEDQSSNEETNNE